MSGHHQLAEAMRRHGSTPAQSNSMPRQATISSYDAAAHSVKVMLQPENIESNWMPLGAIGVGNGWGIVCGPQIGDQVHVSFAEGDFHSGIIVGRVFSTAATAPAAPSGETWMVHQTGSYLKLLNNGDVELVTNRDLLATVGRDLTVNATRDVTATVGRNFSATVTGYAHITTSAETHITATTEITMAAPIVTINAPVIGLNGNVTQTTGGGSAGVTMQGPVHVIDTIHSDAEVTAQSTPLHTHQHLNGGGTGNSGNPTP